MVVKPDGLDVGVGACLLLVRAGGDGGVTTEMMLGHNRVRLVSTDSKVLSSAEKKWLTFETEAYGMYRALWKWAGILMRTQTLGPGVWPPLLWVDSTTAVAKWAGLTVPAAIDHANAKEKRFLSWAEKVSYVRYINLDMKWIPGSANDFADLLSTMVERIEEAVKQREGIPMMHPLGKSVDIDKEESDGTPAGYTALHLALSTEGW